MVGRICFQRNLFQGAYSITLAFDFLGSCTTKPPSHQISPQVPDDEPLFYDNRYRTISVLYDAKSLSYDSTVCGTVSRLVLGHLDGMVREKSPLVSGFRFLRRETCANRRQARWALGALCYKRPKFYGACISQSVFTC